MKYTHLIISKVNIKWLPQSKDKSWLKHRIILLNNILRSSIKSQTNKEFKFVTLWGYEPDRKIDNEYQLIITAEGMTNIWKEMMSQLISLIDEDNVLTTRIDTDNAISYNFVENLHTHIINTDLPFYYDIKMMDMLDLNTRNKKIWPAISTSAFVSVMEKKSEYKCLPYKTEHGRIGTIMNGIKFDDLNALCTIHEDNIYMKNTIGSITNFNEKIKYNLLM